MKTRAAARGAEGFTLVEMLAVIAIIAVLAGLLIPTVITVKNKIREGSTKTEVLSLRMAMEAYYSDWGSYPPDRLRWDGPGGPFYYDSAECLTYFLGTVFRVSDGYTHNTKPYFDFAADRLVSSRPTPYNPSGDFVYLDLLGQRACECGAGNVIFYRFDNNETESGDQDPAHWSNSSPAYDWGDYNRNYTNILRSKVDVWSAGWNAEDPIHQCNPRQPYHPTTDNVATLSATYPPPNYPRMDDIGF